jgi:hypothetical protein
LVITIGIEYRIEKGDQQSDESELFVTFKAGNRILRQGTPIELSFHGKNRNKPNQSFEILTDFGLIQDKSKHDPQQKAIARQLQSLEIC